ncbi:hypothetical protein HK104_008013 [Borealophlyctis nickersoniae]|nr:hypothetical protein HK104_008013 [Borealophlyctis nickersoniae]
MEPVSSIRILQFEFRTNPSSHVAYQLSLQGPVRSWTVWRRYSDFDALHKQLVALNPQFTPPATLPPKSTFPFFSSTSNDPAKIEERRRGLEKYVQAILYDQDARWRRTKEWMDFIGLPDVDRRGVFANGRGGGDGPIFGSSPFGYGSGMPDMGIGGLSGSNFTPESWMEEYRSLQSLCRDIRSHLTARDRQASIGDVAASQNSAMLGKKALSALNSRLQVLNDALKREEIQVNGIGAPPGKHSMGAPSITSGELRRRSDLLTNLHQDSLTLSTLLSSNSSSHLSGSGVPSSAADRSALFSQATSSGSAAPRTTRRFGTHPQETQQTLGLQTADLVTLQREQMQDQDRTLEALATVVRRQQQIGVAIGNELDAHNALLAEVDEGVDRVHRNMKSAGKKLDRVLRG